MKNTQEKATIKIDIRENILSKVLSKIDIEDDLNEIIEDALMQYFDIQINEVIDISLLQKYEKEISNLNKSSSKSGEKEISKIIKSVLEPSILDYDPPYYVYAILDPRYPKKDNILEFSFSFLPFYIGKGIDGRIYSEKNNDVNKRVNEIKDEGLDPIYVIIQNNLKNYEAYKYEASLIYHAYRQDYNLLNIAAGIYFDERYIIIEEIKKKMKEIGRLDDMILKNVLIGLNQEKSVNLAAKKLEISGRTIYRMIKRYNMIYKNGIYEIPF